MSLFVLDTDHVSLLQRGHPAVAVRVLAVSPDELAVTVITFEEQLGAWYTQIRQARNPEKLTRAYEGLSQILEDAKHLRILPFSRSAIDRYLDLRRTYRRVGKMATIGATHILDFLAIKMRPGTPVSGHRVWRCRRRVARIRSRSTPGEGNNIGIEHICTN